MVIAGGKRLVLLLNKIDLVPKENVLNWITHLRRELPCIAFKASTQEQAQRLGHHKQRSLETDGKFSSRCVGADIVMKLLGNYCRNKDVKTAIRVGIVGELETVIYRIYIGLRVFFWRCLNIQHFKMFPGFSEPLQVILLLFTFSSSFFKFFSELSAFFSNLSCFLHIFPMPSLPFSFF